MLFLIVILYQGCAVVGEANGQQQQGSGDKQVSIAQAATPSVQPDVRQPRATETGERTDNKQQITITDARSNAPEWAVIVLNFFLLLVVGYQAYTYKRQADSMTASLIETRSIVNQNERSLKATERSLEIAQQNLIYGQRAYVTITNAEVEHTETGIIFCLKMENSGNTPAKNVRWLLWAQTRKRPPAPVDTRLDSWWPIGLIGPRSHITSRVPIKETTEKLEEGETRYCWGLIRYEDVFGVTQDTAFCFNQVEGPTGMPWGACGPCENGNSAT